MPPEQRESLGDWNSVHYSGRSRTVDVLNVDAVAMKGSVDARAADNEPAKPSLTLLARSRDLELQRAGASRELAPD